MGVTSCLVVATYYVRISLHQLSNSVVIRFAGSVTLTDCHWTISWNCGRHFDL